MASYMGPSVMFGKVYEETETRTGTGTGMEIPREEEKRLIWIRYIR